MTTDYYQALGLSKTATKEEIKKAYKKAALATHPDRAPADKKTQAEEAFRNVNAAYEILSNNETRALYDIHGTWPPPQDLPQRAKQPSRSQPTGRPQPGFYEVPQPASSYHHFVFTDPRALFEAIFEEFKHVHAQQIHAQQQINAQKHVQAAAATYSDAFVPYAPPPAGIFPPQYPSAASFPAFQAQPPPQPFVSSSSRTEQVSTNGLWIKESKVIKLTSTGTREVTLKRTDVDGTIYITRQAGDGSRRYFISKDGVEQPTTEKTPEVPPSSKQQSQSTRQSSSATRYSHTATASQPANFASFAAPQPQTSASAAPKRSSPTYQVANSVTAPGAAVEQRASRSAERAERPPHSSASATYPVQPIPRRALSPVGAELRRNHSMPSNVVPSTPMPRPQSPAFYQRSRTSSSTDALRMKSSTKVSSGYKPSLGAYESQPSSATTSRASSVEPAAVNNSNEFGYIPSSRSKSSKSQSQPPVQSSTTVALNNTVKQRSSEHVATVSQSQFKAPIPQVQPPMQQQVQQQVQQQMQSKPQPKVPQQVQPQVYQSSAPTRSSSQQPTQQVQPQVYQPSSQPRSSSQQPTHRSSHSSSQAAPTARYPPGREPSKIKVTNGLGLGDVPPPPVTGSISGQSRAQEYLTRHQHQQQQQAGLYAPQVPVQRNGSYEFTAQPPQMMYTGAGPVPVPAQQMRMDPTQQWVAHHQDYHRRMQHA